MRRFTEAETLEAYNNAPELVREELSGDTLVDFVIDLQKNYGLHVDVVGQVTEMVRNTLLGLLTPAEFYGGLYEIGLAPDVAQQLTKELNERVFNPLHTKMREGGDQVADVPAPVPSVPAMSLRPEPVATPQAVPPAPRVEPPVPVNLPTGTDPFPSAPLAQVSYVPPAPIPPPQAPAYVPVPPVPQPVAVAPLPVPPPPPPAYTPPPIPQTPQIPPAQPVYEAITPTPPIPPLPPAPPGLVEQFSEDHPQMRTMATDMQSAKEHPRTDAPSAPWLHQGTTSATNPQNVAPPSPVVAPGSVPQVPQNPAGPQVAPVRDYSVDPYREAI